MSRRVLDHYKDNPQDFCPLAIPIAWRHGGELKQHVAVAMHLLFLGITKSTLQLTFKWFKLQGKCSNFLEFAAKLIGGEGPLRKMQLSWLDPTQLTGEKFGGWVAAHFVALSRLLKWVFSIADIVIPDDEYEEPTYPPSDRWLVMELRGWLKCRGLEMSGLKCDLLERVLKYYDREGYREPTGQRGGAVQVVENSMASLQDMIQWIMKRNIDSQLHYKEMERRI
jgi:hypothetical protein